MSLHNKRKVSKVLVMLEYAEGEMSDVYDLTALVREIAELPSAKLQYARLNLEVGTETKYDAPRDSGGRWPVMTTVQWSGSFECKSTGCSGHLEDVINSGLQDSERAQRLRAAHERAEKRLRKLEWDLKQQRIDDAAKIRSQHPIARVRLAPELMNGEGAEA